MISYQDFLETNKLVDTELSQLLYDIFLYEKEKQKEDNNEKEETN